LDPLLVGRAVRKVIDERDHRESVFSQGERDTLAEWTLDQKRVAL